MVRSLSRCPGVLLASILLSGAATAHHSFAMFDPRQEVVLHGTVTKFEWTNPHTWIEMDVPDATGNVVHWSIEGGSVVGLAREGWTRHTLQPGDKIALVMHPLRSGEHGGSLMGVVTAAGKSLGASLEAPTKTLSGAQP
jgi:hypothetical protein